MGGVAHQQCKQVGNCATVVRAGGEYLATYLLVCVGDFAAVADLREACVGVCAGGLRRPIALY